LLVRPRHITGEKGVSGIIPENNVFRYSVYYLAPRAARNYPSQYRQKVCTYREVLYMSIVESGFDGNVSVYRAHSSALIDSSLDGAKKEKSPDTAEM
jgi:hypothetical protein